MGQTPADPRELAALRAGLSSVTDETEKRNMRYENAARLYEETRDPEFKKMMDEINPSPTANALWGTGYGVAEGILTPWVVRDLMGFKDPGIPTTGQQVGRIAGNVVGGGVGLGKASAMLGGIKAAPKAIAGLYAMSGLGQALGGRSETEHQKAAQRQFMTGTKQEIPSYMQETKLTDPSALMNVIGQSAVSALGGGLGQKALKLNKIYTPASLASSLTEGGVSMGLALNDAASGNLMEAYNANPSGYRDMGAMVGAMSLAGASAPFGANALMRRPKAVAQAKFDGAPPPQPTHTPAFQDIPLNPGRSFEFGRGNIPDHLLPALQVSHMQRIAGLPLDQGDQKLNRSLMNTSQGRFVGQDGEDLLELLAHIGVDDHMDIGSAPAQGSYVMRSLANPEDFRQTTERALSNPMDLHFQPSEGGGSVPLPKGSVPLSNPREVEYTDPSGVMGKGWAVAKHPEGMWIKTPTGLRLIQTPAIKAIPESNSALAPRKAVPSTAQGRSTKLPTSTQDVNMAALEIENKIAMLKQSLAELGLGDRPVASHDVPPQPALPMDMPSLPFDLSDVLGASNWNLSKPFGTRKQ